MLTDQQHPITPPPELVEQWINEPGGLSAVHVATQAARWGADQELEACCAWLQDPDLNVDTYKLRAARRPKPPSLAEQALEACERSAFGIPGDRDIIRRALKRLQELENNDN